MTYVEGFLLAVPTKNKDVYRQHAEAAWPLFHEFGATRLFEGWGDDMPRGQVNDLWGAVAATEGETVVFSWIEYPDRATRDAATRKMMSDPRMEALGDMPFDGKRMIWSGFEMQVETGPGGDAGYIDGIVVAVPTARREDHVRYCEMIDPAFVEHGAVRVIDAWGDDVQKGKVTDFLRATKAQDDETVVFGWVEWPSKQAREAGWEALRADPRMTDASVMPFDGKRMMFGGFVPIVDQKGA